MDAADRMESTATLGAEVPGGIRVSKGALPVGRRVAFHATRGAALLKMPADGGIEGAATILELHKGCSGGNLVHRLLGDEEVPGPAVGELGLAVVRVVPLVGDQDGGILELLKSRLVLRIRWGEEVDAASCSLLGAGRGCAAVRGFS